MVGTYDYWLVLLSVVVAITASYVALELAARITAAKARKTAWTWLIGGAIALGTGIWSMHFIGMLAFVLPIPVSYDIPITVLSLVIAIVASGCALHLVSSGDLRIGRLTTGSLMMGFAIISMHYVGIEAMPMDPPIHYRPLLVGLSILIAVAGSSVALWSAFRLRMETISTAFWKKAGSAVVLGTGVYGMHYAGMLAAVFAPNSVCSVSPQNFNHVWLAGTLGGLTLLFLMAMLFLSAFDAYLAERSAERAESLGRLNSELDLARAELERRVAERTADLARANKKLVEAQETERRLLSRELHDRVGQSLTALGINLDILRTQGSATDHSKLRSRLEDSIALVEATADAIEDVMSELRPPMLDDYGLLPALQWYAKEFSQRTGIEVEVRGNEPKERPGPEIEITLFRIAQEALNNVAKHARATRVELALEEAKTECALSVSDNGAGFDPQSLPHPGRGMETMRERAQVVGGHFEVRSEPGGGTHISVRVPLLS